MEAKYCPITRNDCQGNCAWYVAGLNGCALNVLAQAVDDLANNLSDAVLEVGVANNEN